MIHHISISAADPRHVAEVIAELWRGTALPFPPTPGSYIVIPGDAYGTAIEVYPLGKEVVPGGDGREVQTREGVTASPYTATHAALSVPVDEARVREIAEREGWRVERFSRGGAFEVLEFWVEGRLLLELLTPELVPGYLDFMMPRKYASLFGIELPAEGARRAKLRAA
jgi:hypothetical protein